MDASHICHICLLPIPDHIAHKAHPLFGTKDHIRPRSNGGKTSRDNLAPAHFCCNQMKGSAEVTAKLTEQCQRYVRPFLDRSGWNGEMRTTRNRVEYLIGIIERQRREMSSMESYCVGEGR